MSKNKLIDELSELAQICLDYKNHVEFEKKQKQEGLNESLNHLGKLGRSKYGYFYTFLCNAEKDDLIGGELADKHFQEFEKELEKIVDDYTTKKDDTNESVFVAPEKEENNGD